MVTNDSNTERRTVKATDRRGKSGGAGRSGECFSLSKPLSHRTSRRFETRLFWG